MGEKEESSRMGGQEENRKNKHSSQSKIVVVVFHYYAIMILRLKRFSERLEDVCRGPDASIELKIEEVHKKF